MAETKGMFDKVFSNFSLDDATKIFDKTTDFYLKNQSNQTRQEATNIEQRTSTPSVTSGNSVTGLLTPTNIVFAGVGVVALIFIIKGKK